MLQTGQTPLSIARRMGFISVVEILKTVTQVNVSTSEIDDGYNIVYPETMVEPPMDSDEEGGECLLNLNFLISWFFLSFCVFLSNAFSGSGLGDCCADMYWYVLLISPTIVLSLCCSFCINAYRCVCLCTCMQKRFVYLFYVLDIFNMIV